MHNLINNFVRNSAALAAILLSGCVAAAVNRFEEKLQTRVGQPIATVVTDWGAPSSKTEIPGAGTVYLWAQQPGALNRCEVTFTTDAQGTVKQWQRRGSDCPWVYH